MIPVLVKNTLRHTSSVCEFVKRDGVFCVSCEGAIAAPGRQCLQHTSNKARPKVSG